MCAEQQGRLRGPLREGLWIMGFYPNPVSWQVGKLVLRGGWEKSKVTQVVGMKLSPEPRLLGQKWLGPWGHALCCLH